MTEIREQEAAEQQLAAQALDEARRLGRIQGRFANHGITGVRTLVGVLLPLSAAERVADLLDRLQRQEELGVEVDIDVELDEPQGGTT